MNDNYFLISLLGLKSLHLKIVDEYTFNWVLTGENISEFVKDDILDSVGINENQLEQWIFEHNDNDRALSVTSIASFFNIKDLLEYLNSNNIIISDEYTGVLY